MRLGRWVGGWVNELGGWVGGWVEKDVPATYMPVAASWGLNARVEMIPFWPFCRERFAGRVGLER